MEAATAKSTEKKISKKEKNPKLNCARRVEEPAHLLAGGPESCDRTKGRHNVG
ncbi:hypothetical protein GJAV_G00141910 [Gymnothorax javanicus]|nr:hypothetical protein GJAV_G00141910 [Gymnothorax javanicus]